MQMESSELNKEVVFEKLYTAKWNVPRAAKALSITDDECKEEFRAFMRSQVSDRV